MNVSSQEPSRGSTPTGGVPAPPARVVVFTRESCHLCDEALEIVSRSCEEAGVTWCAVDIDSSPDLRTTHGDYVPVVVVDGVQQGFWHIDEARLRRVLASNTRDDASGDAHVTLTPLGDADV